MSQFELAVDDLAQLEHQAIVNTQGIRSLIETNFLGCLKQDTCYRAREISHGQPLCIITFMPSDLSSSAGVLRHTGDQQSARRHVLQVYI